MEYLQELVDNRSESARSASYFRQRRCPDGYKIGYCGLWLSSATQPQRAIISRRVKRRPARTDFVDLADNDGVWVRFSRIRSESDMCEFARQFGLLGHDTSSSGPAVQMRKNASLWKDFRGAPTICRRIWARENRLNELSDEELKARYAENWVHDITVDAELVDAWWKHLSDIKPLVKLLHAVRNEKVAYLKQKFRWQRSKIISRDLWELRYNHEENEFLSIKEVIHKASQSDPKYPEDMIDFILSVNTQTFTETLHDPSIINRMKSDDDIVTLARMFLSDRVNWHLKNISSAVQIGLVFDKSFSAQQLRIVPDSLIAAIWYHFARAVASGPDISICRQCENFYVKQNKRGSEQRYCSNACKTKSYRLRKEQEAA